MIRIKKRFDPYRFFTAEGSTLKNFRAIVYIIFFASFGFFLVTCRSYEPKKNIFLNKAGWKRLPYKTILFKSKHLDLFLYSESFSQGKVVYIEILPAKKASKEGEKKEFKELKHISLTIAGSKTTKILLSYLQWGYRAFWGVPPNARVGQHKVLFSYEYEGEKISVPYFIQIGKTKYTTFKKVQKLDPPKDEPVDKEKQKEIYGLITYSIKKKQAMFKHISEDKINHELAHPRDEHHITSPFWTKRISLKYKVKGRKRIYLKPKIKYHRGLDLRGKIGTPIYAIAAGRVLIAEKLYYEGNFTLIDHGNHIFSGYMHQNEIDVNEGEYVDAGEYIGEVGDTGFVTGPHLHIFLKINNVYVDPLSILSLPVRG